MTNSTSANIVALAAELYDACRRSPVASIATYAVGNCVDHLRAIARVHDVNQTMLIPLDAEGCVHCVVDFVDYEWALQWEWRFQWDRWGRKMYAVRNTRIEGKQVKLYLHKEILERKGAVPPTPEHTIGDHEDGNSLNNRRGNLSYATPMMNAATSKRWKK